MSECVGVVYGMCRLVWFCVCVWGGGGGGGGEGGMCVVCLGVGGCMSEWVCMWVHLCGGMCVVRACVWLGGGWGVRGAMGVGM